MPKELKKDPAYVEKVLAMPRPERGRDLLRFLGAINWVSKYIKDYASIASSLIKLQKTDKESMKSVIKWTEPMIEAFEKIKECLKEDVCLAHALPYEESGSLYLFTDASLSGLGGHLSQIQGFKDGQYKEDVDLTQEGLEMRVIGYWSCSLTGAQTRMSTFDRELEGVRKALKHFKSQLIGRFFYLVVDHKSLIYLHKMKITNSRLARISQELGQFNFEIKWIPGEKNVLADSLSRIGYLDFLKNEKNGLEDSIPPCLQVVEIPGGGDCLIECLVKFHTYIKEFE